MPLTSFTLNIFYYDSILFFISFGNTTIYSLHLFILLKTAAGNSALSLSLNNVKEIAKLEEHTCIHCSLLISTPLACSEVMALSMILSTI